MSRILFESASFQEHENISGVGYYAKTLANQLVADHEVMLTRGPFGSNNLLNKLYRKAASYRLAIPYDLTSKPYDLALFPNFASLPTVRANKRAVVVHDLTYLYQPSSVESKNLDYLRRVVPRSIANCDYVITVSETVKQEIVDEFSIDNDRVIVTPIPPRQEISEGTKDNEIHEKYGIPTKRYLLFIGNMEPRKNVDYLIDAYLELPAEFQQQHSLIIGGGKGWGSNSTLQRIKSLRKKNIRHIGYIDDEDIASVYAQAEVFLFGSHYEGFGMPILESLACGTPVITSNITVFNEILGESGIYTASATEMALHIKDICNDSKKKQIALNKQAAVLGKYSWQDNVSAIERLL